MLAMAAYWNFFFLKQPTLEFQLNITKKLTEKEIEITPLDSQKKHFRNFYDLNEQRKWSK